MRRITMSAISAFALLLGLVTIAVGKEPMIAIAPVDATPNQPTRITFQLTVDGHTIQDFGGSVVLAFHDAAGTEVKAEAREMTTPGSYQATLTFPHAGSWTAAGWLQMGADRAPFAEVDGARQLTVRALPPPSTPVGPSPFTVAVLALLLLAVVVGILLGRKPTAIRWARAHVGRRAA